MKRPIKFRGRTCGNVMVYGDLRHMVETEGIGCLVASTRHYVTVDDIEVTPESVAQLVGYDANGNEVYEGDKVVSEYVDEIVARLMDNLPPKAKLQE